VAETDFNVWKNTPGKIKEQRDPNNQRRLLYIDDAIHLTEHGYLVKLKPPLQIGWFSKAEKEGRGEKRENLAGFLNTQETRESEPRACLQSKG